MPAPPPPLPPFWPPAVIHGPCPTKPNDQCWGVDYSNWQNPTLISHCCPAGTACVKGLIVTAIGPKLLFWRWDGAQLVGVAFLDSRIHCHGLLAMKNVVLSVDLFQGLDL